MKNLIFKILLTLGVAATVAPVANAAVYYRSGYYGHRNYYYPQRTYRTGYYYGTPRYYNNRYYRYKNYRYNNRYSQCYWANGVYICR